jgi:large subunit ribosomal protein L31
VAVQQRITGAVPALIGIGRDWLARTGRLGRAPLQSAPGASKLAGHSRQRDLSFLGQFWKSVMKPGIHPEYRQVVFQDISSDFAILTCSTIETKEKIKWEDGNEYPLVKVEVSSASHPFYTGKHKVLDSGGRVDRFKKRYGK